VPGSVINDEEVQWERFEGISPYSNDANEDISKVALSTALYFLFPNKGSRDSFMMTVACLLCRAKWTAEEINNYVLFKGRMDTLTVNDGDTFSVIISAENKLIDLTRPKNLFYTPETQNFLHAGDKGLEFVPRIQEQTVNWGATRSGSGGGSGGGGDVPIYDLR